MKSNDIAMLILIVSISVVLSYFVGTSVFNGDNFRQKEVEVVQAVSPDFPEIDENVFNTDSINLTETINIGDTSSNKPFTSGN